MQTIAMIIASFIITTNGIPVVYDHEGTLYGTTDTYEVMFYVHMDGYATHCDKLKDIIKANSNTETTACEHANVHMLERQCDVVEGWAVTFQTDRVKRQAMLIGSVLGSLGISLLMQLGGYMELTTKIETNHQALVQLRAQMTTYTARQHNINEKLAKEVNCHKIRLALLESEMLILATTAALEGLISNQHVTPAILPTKEVARLWPQIQREIKNFTGGAASFMFPPHALYEIPASYIYDGNTLRVFLHMPLVQEELQLYRRSTFPLIAHTNPPQHATETKPYIATNTEGTTHMVMDGNDLATCHIIQQARFCKVGLLFRTFASTCEGALFEGRPSTIKQRCKLAEFKDKWAVTQTGDNDFSIYLAEQEEAMRTCEDGTRMVIHVKSGFTNVSVPTGCTFTTLDFVLPAHHDYTSTLHVINHVSFEAEDLAELLVLPGEERSGASDTEGDVRTDPSMWIWAAAGAAIAGTCANAGVFIILVWRFRAKMRGKGRKAQKKRGEKSETDKDERSENENVSA